MRIRDYGPHIYAGKTYYTKAEMLKAQSQDRQLEKWRNKNPEPKRSKYQKWLCTFIEEKEIDLSDFVDCADGTLQVGDVVQAMHDAPKWEADEIQKTLVMIDFKNGDVLHFIAHLAKALHESDKVKL